MAKDKKKENVEAKLASEPKVWPWIVLILFVWVVGLVFIHYSIEGNKLIASFIYTLLLGFVGVILYLRLKKEPDVKEFIFHLDTHLTRDSVAEYMSKDVNRPGRYIPTLNGLCGYFRPIKDGAKFFYCSLYEKNNKKTCDVVVETTKPYTITELYVDTGLMSKATRMKNIMNAAWAHVGCPLQNPSEDKDLYFRTPDSIMERREGRFTNVPKETVEGSVYDY